MNSKVDDYINQSKQWQAEMRKLRSILLGCGLTEELKWRQPCYTFNNNNIAILQGFKAFGALMFFKGALMKDPKEILEKPGDNSQAARRFPFTNLQDITKVEPTLKAYIREAIEVEKSGLEVSFKKVAEFEVPEELQSALDESSDFNKAFKALTPGRQRAYLLHFSSPKQSKTRQSRVEKCRQRILAGKGLTD
jgi:uncharacterized protein YdeI (YjbR/CyaY-like superfamily)